MMNKNILTENEKEIYDRIYSLMKNEFMKMVEGYKDKVPSSKIAIEAFQRGYEQGFIKGKEDAFRMKENADGCKGCAFEDRNSWEMPCEKCCNNNKNYWRAKVGFSNE